METKFLNKAESEMKMQNANRKETISPLAKRHAKDLMPLAKEVYELLEQISKMNGIDTVLLGELEQDVKELYVKIHNVTDNIN